MEIQKSIIFIEKEKMIMEKFLKEMTNGEYAIVDSKTVILSTDAETNLITLTCINCENTMEFCSSDPIYLGKYHEKDLYLNFWVNSAGYDSMKKITYTLYKEL